MLFHCHQQFRFKPVTALVKQRHSLVLRFALGGKKLQPAND
jgi:hypothetical protein